MKLFKILFIIVVVVMLCFSFISCGKSTEDNDDTSVTSSSDAALSGDSNEELGNKEQKVAVYDYTTTIDKLLGKWQQVSATDRTITISEVENGYQYEDKEGKYPATFEQGLLKVKATETDTVMVYINKDTGKMIIDFNGSFTECERSK